MFVAALFTIANILNKIYPCSNRWMDLKKTKCDTHNVLLFSHNDEGNSAICDDVDGPWRHYVKWNKLDWFQLDHSMISLMWAI